MAKATKPRTAAQKAATAKLVAANKKRRATASKATAAPAKAKRTYAKAAPAKKVYKRNPIGNSAGVKRGKGMFEENIKPAAMGAAAAIGFDIVWGKMSFIPANLRAGNLKYPVKLLGALALGVVAEKYLPKQHKHHAATLVRGPLTVIMHDAAKDFMATAYPSLHLDAYEADQMAEILHEMNGYDDEDMNGYDDDSGVEFAPQQHITQVGETLQPLQGFSSSNLPQYDGAAY